MLTETLWNRAMDREWVFNPLEARVASAPAQLLVLCSALHLPKWYGGAHDVMSALCCLAIQCSLLDGRQVGLVQGSVWGGCPRDDPSLAHRERSWGVSAPSVVTAVLTWVCGTRCLTLGQMCCHHPAN